LGVLTNMLTWNQMLDNAELGGHCERCVDFTSVSHLPYF
jgi:hypothetical protein